MATDMADFVDPGAKSDPAVVAAAALDGLAARETEVPADGITRRVRHGLSDAPPAA